jgi:hypothetical protein
VNEDSQLDGDGYLYDAIVTRVDAGHGTMLFTVGEATHRVKSPHVISFSQGAVGRLRLPTERDSFVFQTYADQRLRRAPELDDPREDRWGWRIGTRRFAVTSGLLPGYNGSVVPRDTETLALPLPREFLDYCHGRKLTPATVLRSFIGDLCVLSSPFERPREDGYTSSGSDACELANAYFKHAFDNGDDSGQGEKPTTVKRRRRQARNNGAADSPKSGDNVRAT